MQVDGVAYRTIWPDESGQGVKILDQTLFPHGFKVVTLASLEDAARAISDMLVRGAPLIGATAAYGVALAMLADSTDDGLSLAVERLARTRPTAINLRWALNRMDRLLRPLAPSDRRAAAWAEAAALADEDVAINSALGDHGLPLSKHWLRPSPARP